MKPREEALEQAALLRWWADRGRNDARELGFVYYDGAENSEYKEAYVLAYEKEMKKVINDE